MAFQIASDEATFIDSVRLLQVSHFDGAICKWGMPEGGHEKWSRPVDEILTGYAATSSSCSSVRSTITPFSNVTPARTSATRCGALTARHRV